MEASRAARGLVRQGVAGTLLAAVSGMQVGFRFCARDFDSVFWGACMTVAVGVAISTRSLLRRNRSG